MQPTVLEQPRQEVRAFWTGPALSFYEQLSLKSMAAAGARVILYSYEDDLAVPDGVELADAREILPWPSDGYREENRNSSLALHSDLFRYLTLHKFGGWYMDLDLIVLGDRLPSHETYVAYGGADWVNTAVMRFPQGRLLWPRRSMRRSGGCQMRICRSITPTERWLVPHSSCN